MSDAKQQTEAAPKQRSGETSARETPAKDKMPAAGPHAKPELTDKDKTPKSGMLSEPDEKHTEAPTG